MSIDEAIWHLLKAPKEENKISDLAGGWEMSEREAREIERLLSKGWGRRQPPRFV